jgi:4-hydroxy-tetrahydrodipicolinate synthase
MPREIKGAICEIATPFFEDGSIDRESYLNMVEYQISCGINGFFINGEGADSPQLTNEERIEMARLTVKKVAGRVPIIGGLVTLTRMDAAELMSEYERLDGVDSICALPPFASNLPQPLLYEYYANLAKSTTKPVYIYNQPTCGLLSEDTVVKLAHDFENIAGYKDTTQNVIMLQNILSRIDKPFAGFGGSDAFIWPMATLGLSGVISFLGLPFPKPVVEFYKLWEAGKYKEAFDKNMELMRMRAVLKKGSAYGGKAGYYYATELVGMPIRGTRLPVSLLEVTDEQKYYIETEARKVGWL